ncbi:class E sortase [Streptomyces sp. SCSIO 75703]|uniref:class E sortase n=1 Tax=unclassified Streptomyces TaxID=2593676 RepID=UPI0006B616E2|nr:class E sortase [Streptomyces sp. TP-A0875]
MTALRPERASGAAGDEAASYAGAYGGSGALGDGLYGDPGAGAHPPGAEGGPGGAHGHPGDTHGHPGGAHGHPGTHGHPGGAHAYPGGAPGHPDPDPGHPPGGRAHPGDAYGHPGAGDPYTAFAGDPYFSSATAAHPPVADDETMALRLPEAPPEPAPAAVPAADGPPGGGRAARRKAARRRQGRRAAGGRVPAAPEGGEEPEAPLSRVEARRRARARKPGAAAVASRAVGEVFITTGVLMLLFVTYQLWWTNVRAHAQADQATSSLQDDWANGKRNPGAFEPGQGFAILHIPKLDVVVPIAEGIDSKKVLDRGMVGHYAEEGLKTAMPEAKTGNFGLAGHRNTHGEPFRYINKLNPGDPIVVETQDTYFVYKMASILPVTPPSNIGVLDPVPAEAGFTEPGRYVTLTTCTPEFTSKYRMIVWGKMDEERPRSKGKPDALVR